MSGAACCRDPCRRTRGARARIDPDMIAEVTYSEIIQGWRWDPVLRAVHIGRARL
jgi:hypothetical protein